MGGYLGPINYIIKHSPILPAILEKFLEKLMKHEVDKTIFLL